MIPQRFVHTFPLFVLCTRHKRPQPKSSNCLFAEVLLRVLCSTACVKASIYQHDAGNCVYLSGVFSQTSNCLQGFEARNTDLSARRKTAQALLESAKHNTGDLYSSMPNGSLLHQHFVPPTNSSEAALKRRKKSVLDNFRLLIRRRSTTHKLLKDGYLSYPFCAEYVTRSFPFGECVKERHSLAPWDGEKNLFLLTSRG